MILSIICSINPPLMSGIVLIVYKHTGNKVPIRNSRLTDNDTSLDPNTHDVYYEVV